MEQISEGILEAAWLTVDRGGSFCPDATPEEEAAAWIRVFTEEVNKRLPDGVELNTARCMQTGDSAAFVPEDKFAEILDQAEHETDRAAFTSWEQITRSAG